MEGQREGIGLVEPRAGVFYKKLVEEEPWHICLVGAEASEKAELAAGETTESMEKYPDFELPPTSQCPGSNG